MYSVEKSGKKEIELGWKIYTPVNYCSSHTNYENKTYFLS